MSNVQDFIDSLEAKVKELEQSVVNAASQIKQWSDNHQGLLGMLEGTKTALADAQKIVNVVAPGSSVAQALNISEEVVSAVDSAVQ